MRIFYKSVPKQPESNLGKYMVIATTEKGSIYLSGDSKFFPTLESAKDYVKLYTDELMIVQVVAEGKIKKEVVWDS